MAESKEVNIDAMKESLNHENESMMTVNPADLNKPLDIAIISLCKDEESITLDLANANPESRKSDEIPEQNTSPDIASCIQKTDESEQIAFVPDSDSTNKIVRDPIAPEGNCSKCNVNLSSTNINSILFDTNSCHFI